MPKLLKLPVQLAPAKLQQLLMEQVLNRAFIEAIEDGDFEFLEGRWLKLEVRDLSKAWYISFKQQRLVVASTIQEHQLCFSGNTNDLVLLMGRKEDPDTLFFQRRLLIEGDTEMGLEVKNLIDNLEFEQLPKLAQQAIAQSSSLVAKYQLSA